MCVCLYVCINLVHIHHHVFVKQPLFHKDLNVKKENNQALAGVPQWIECCPANLRVTGLIPSKGTCLVCRPGPPGNGCARGDHTGMFPLPSPLSKNK